MRDERKILKENVSVIDASTILTGNYIGCQETLIIAGRLEGKVQTDGNVVISLRGEADADLKASNICNFGAIKGSVKVKERLEIRNTGKVNGDVNYATLDINEGGILNGKCAHSANEKINLTPFLEKSVG